MWLIVYLLVGYILKVESSLSPPNEGTYVTYEISIFKHLSVGRKAKTAKESFVVTVPTLSLVILKLCKDSN